MSDFSAETPLVTARIEFVLKRMQGNIVQMMQDHTGEINKHMEEEADEVPCLSGHPRP